MQKYSYKTVWSVVILEGEVFKSWGIACYSGNEQLMIIRDISTEKALVENAAALFCKLQLSPVHFTDAVEDLLD